MKTNKILVAFLSSVIALCFASCADTFKDGSYTETELYKANFGTAYDYNVNPEGDVLSINVDASDYAWWSLSNLPSWLSSENSSGMGIDKVTLRAIQNPSFEEDRTAVLYFQADGGSRWHVSRPVTITQKARTKQLYMTPSSNNDYQFTSSYHSQTLSIKSNISWKLESSSSFVYFSQTSGTGDATVTMYVSSYTTDDVKSRSATITLIESGNDKVYQTQVVTQEAKGVTKHTGSLTFTADGGTVYKYSLGTTNDGFTASSDQSWLTVTPTSGSGSIDVTIKAAANTLFTSRTGQVTIYINGSITPFYVYTVTQAAKEIKFSLSESSHSFGCYKAETYPTLTSNVSWTAKSDQTWLTVSPASGSGNATITVSATSDNTTSAARSGTITFTYQGKTTTYSVTQAKAGITISGTPFEFYASGGTKSLYISGTGSWTATENLSWLSLDKTSGYDDAEIKLTATSNTSSLARSGTVTVKSQNGTSNNISVSQKGKVNDYINLSPDTLRFKADGISYANYMIDVDASDTWTATTTASWLTIHTYSSLIFVYATENTSLSSRTANITFTCGTATKKAVIIQDASTKYNGHEFVDLGLPSGLKWATCNIGASAPEKVGNYYAWGETTTKTSYTSDTYKYYIGGKYTKYTYWASVSYTGVADYKTTLDSSDDAARQNWGGNWRMPTKTEAEELTSKCTYTITTVNGVKVGKYTGSNGNFIVIPFNSFYGSTDTTNIPWVWTSSLYLGSNFKNSEGYLLYGTTTYDYFRYYGFPIRPVFK